MRVNGIFDCHWLSTSAMEISWIPLTLPMIFTPLKLTWTLRENVWTIKFHLEAMMMMMIIIIINDDDDDCDDDTYQVKGLGWHEMSCLGSEQVLTGIRTFWWGNAVFLRPCSFTRTPLPRQQVQFDTLCGPGAWAMEKMEIALGVISVTGNLIPTGFAKKQLKHGPY